MNAEQFVTNVKGLEAYDNAVRTAVARPGKIARIQPGWYIVAVNEELVEVMQRTVEHITDRRAWDFHEIRNRWVGDPLPTLADVKAALQLR